MNKIIATKTTLERLRCLMVVYRKEMETKEEDTIFNDLMADLDKKFVEKRIGLWTYNTELIYWIAQIYRGIKTEFEQDQMIERRRR